MDFTRTRDGNLCETCTTFSGEGYELAEYPRRRALCLHRHSLHYPPTDTIDIKMQNKSIKAETGLILSSNDKKNNNENDDDDDNNNSNIYTVSESMRTL